jgi:hypothetical protein
MLPKTMILCGHDGACKGSVKATQRIPRTAKIHLCDELFKKKANKEFKIGIKKQAAIVIHEVSHSCGTLDFEYNRSPRNQYGPFNIASNADNFEYWAVHGFCLPDLDCKNSKKEYSFSAEKFLMKTLNLEEMVSFIEKLNDLHELSDIEGLF